MMLPHYKLIIVNLLGLLLIASIVGIYKYIFPKKKVNLLVLIICLSMLAVISVLRKGAIETTDFYLHTTFLMGFYRSLLEGHLFPQWAADMNGGYGFPAYIFMYQLPYYIASFFISWGFSFIDSTKLFLMAAFVLSGATMYLWSKEEFGNFQGFLSTILYQFSPYHLIQLHYITSFGETLAFSVLPLAFYSVRKYFYTRKYLWFVLIAISYSLIILTHQTIGIILLPFISIYICILFRRVKKKFILVKSFVGVLLGIVLAAYYWLPVLFQAKYITEHNIRSIEFPSFWELFYTKWRYGLLFQGNNAEISVFLGYGQWIAILLALILVVKKVIKASDKSMTYFALVSFAVIFFLMQKISAPFWQLPLLEHFQKTSRLMPLAIFFSSILAAIVSRHSEKLVSIANKFLNIKFKLYKIIFHETLTNKTKETIFILLFSVLTMLSTILNWGNRNISESVTDASILNDKFPIAVDGSIMPIWFKNNKSVSSNKVRQKHIEVISGKAKIRELSRLSTRHTYLVTSEMRSIIKENTAYFPGWEVNINGRPTKINYTLKNDPGILIFDIPKGKALVEVKFVDTRVKQISNAISLTGIAVILLFPLIKFSALQKNKNLKEKNEGK